MKTFFKEPVRTLQIKLSRLGRSKKCYICNKEFGRFTTFRGGFKNFSPWIRSIKPIGSDVDNFGCPYCFCCDRDRHLFMFFDKLRIWEKMTNSSILHFAPERSISMKIKDCHPIRYVKGDLFPNDSDIEKIDATDIPFQDASFDIIIGNHILEHIPDHRKAISEMHRVLKSGGIAIVQTPYSELLHSNFEDEGINSDELRQFFYGQEDHVRVFGKKQFLSTLEDLGFKLLLTKHSDLFDSHEARYFGVNEHEDLIQIQKIGKN